MPKITYIEFNGIAHDVEVDVGLSVMEGAVRNGIPGIDADCGGACACGTCHVYVAENCRGLIGAAVAAERAMLECVIDPQDNSRLSCQIEVSDALNGLVVYMPKSQR